jgi:trigger factor
MQVSVEKESSIKYRLDITIQASQIEAAYNQQIDTFAQNASIKGFRPGKVPKSYIQKQYGEAARQEALNELIKSSFLDAIKQEKLIPINTPKIELKPAQNSETIQFSASFEILPEIQAVNLAMDKIEKLTVEVKDSDVQYAVDQLRKQYATWTPVARPAQEKDRLVVDYYPIFEDKEDLDNKVQGFTLELGSKMMLPGFEDGLIGAKANEERTLELTFPADYATKEKAGKPIKFVVQIKEVVEGQIPELDEIFVKQLGVKSGTSDELLNEIKQLLTKECDRLVREKLKEQVFQQLLEQNSVDVPESLITNEAIKIHDEIYPAHQPHNHHQHSDTELASFNDVAKKRVTLGLLVNAYVKHNNIKVNKELVFERIRDIAASYDDPQQVVKWLSSEERLSGIEAQVLEDQVLNQLVEGLPVTEKIMSYAELKGIRI